MVGVNGVDGLRGAIQASLSEMHSNKEMKARVFLEKPEPGSFVLGFEKLNRDKIPGNWGSVVLAYSPMEKLKMDNVRYSVAKGGNCGLFQHRFQRNRRQERERRQVRAGV